MDESIINWVDTHQISKDRIILTEDDTHIPGLRLFATHNIQKALLPLAPHFHKDAFEFTLLTKGNMRFFTDSELYSVTGGDVFISYPNEIHSTDNFPISLNQQYWMQVDISNPEHFFFLERKSAEQLISKLNSLQGHIFKVDPNIISLVEKAFSLIFLNDNSSLAAALIVVFLEELVTTLQKENFISEDIKKALLYIENHLSEDIALDELAALSNLSTSQFKQKFRRQLGRTPREFINHAKIEKAKILLQSNQKITDVALQIGFDNISYFSNVFKKYTTMSPREYVYAYKKDEL